MQINPNKTPNIPKGLEPLFEAMKAGETIKSVTCMAGTDNKDDRSKDFKIENFTVEWYSIGMSRCYENGITESFDFVFTNTESVEKTFYMTWVIAYEL